MISEAVRTYREIHDQKILEKVIRTFQAKVLKITYREDGKEKQFFPKAATLENFPMVDFSKRLTSASDARRNEWTSEDEQDWQSLFASETASNSPKARGYFNNGENKMKAPAPATQGTVTRRDDSQRVQFFNVDRLAGIPQQITIKAVEFVQTNYGDVTFTLEMNGRPYIWDRKLNSNAYAVIFGAFGEDTDKWIGKSLTAQPYFNPKFKQTEVQLVAPKGKGSK